MASAIRDLPETRASCCSNHLLEGGQTYAEVAHEVIFRRWDKLRDWVVAEREFLAWRTWLEVSL
jgi:hypothetical protein